MRKESVGSLLAKQGHVTYPIVGRSMYPVLLMGDNVLIKKQDDYQVGDVVLFLNKVDPSFYILHRIRKIEDNKYYLLGDNSLRLDILTKEEILGKMISIYRKGELLNEIPPFIERIDIDEYLEKGQQLILSRFDAAVREVSKLLIDPSYKNKINMSLINNLTCEEFDHLLDFLTTKKSLHLLGLILDQINNVFLKEEQYKELKSIIDNIKLRYIRITELEKRITSLCNENKIKFMFLKGSEVRKLYPSPYLRVSNDIDLYVDKSDLTRMKDVLKKEYNAKETLSEIEYHDSLIIDKYKMDVEVHYDLKYNLKKEHAYLLSDPFIDAVVDKDNPYQYHMNPNRYYLYHLMHSAKHMANELAWLAMFSDSYLLKKNFDIDLSLVKESNLIDFEVVNQSMEEHFFFDKKITKENEINFLKFFYIDSYTRYISLNKGKHPSKARFILYRIFAPRSTLMSQYPSLVKRPYLMPLYQIRRWLNIFSKGKLKTNMKEVKEYSKSNDEVYQWIKENGLEDFIRK